MCVCRMDDLAVDSDEEVDYSKMDQVRGVCVCAHVCMLSVQVRWADVGGETAQLCVSVNVAVTAVTL